MSKYESSLKNTVLELIEELKTEVFTLNEDEEDDMFKISFFFKQMPARSVAAAIVRELIPHSEQIETRDQKFFETNRMLFSGLPEDRVDYYIDIITSSARITEEDKAVVWDYFDTILALAKRCKKEE